MRSRCLFATGLLAAMTVAACGSSKPASPPSCTSFSTAEALCASQGCDATWAAVETNPAYCACGFDRSSAGDCGDYHVLESTGVDNGARYYYRRDTGLLVYAQFFSAPSPSGICASVGTAAFSAPANCESSALSPLPGWCSQDAGTCPDGSAAP